MTDSLRTDIIKNKNKTQTAHSNIIVPVVQNLLGGLSVSLILYFYLSDWVFILNAPFTGTTIIIGITIAAFFNVYRFFSDELYISAAIFWLGFQSGKLLNVDKANKELATVINKSVGTTNSTAETNALRLIVAHYEKNIKITADTAKTYLKLSRNEFEEAKRILVASGLLKNTKAIVLNAENQQKALLLFKSFKEGRK